MSVGDDDPFGYREDLNTTRALLDELVRFILQSLDDPERWSDLEIARIHELYAKSKEL
jgi:hypothetical protein